MTAVATHEPAAAPAAPRPAAPTRSAAPTVSPTAPWSLGAVSVRAPGGAEQEDPWLLDWVADAVRSLPGYSLASAALGQDLLTGRPVPGTVGETLETLLTAAGPFGAGVGAALGAFDVLGEAVGAVQRAFAEHRVSVARIGRDVAAAWDRLDAMLGIDGNVAIVRGYVDAFLADVRAAVAQVVAGLIAAVRAAVVPLVEPLLADPAIAPAWDLATKVMGTNPLSGVPVVATTAEILAAFLTVIGRVEVLEQMRERGTLQQTADWLDTQLGRFQDLVGQATALFADAWDAISPQNLPGLLDSLPALARRAAALFDGVVDFAGTVIGQVLALIKDSLLGMLSEHAAQVPGFTLLTVILGRNPFTSAPVERTPAALIGGFIQLLPGGAETFRELSESGVIEDAGARIESEMDRLGITWDLVTETFRAIWDGFTLEDLLDPFGAIQRVIEQFGEPLGRIVSFVATVVQVVVELVLRLMNVPTELLAGILAGVTAAISDIKADPVGFLQNLLATLRAGFERFFDHILPHLAAGLAGWLFRGLRDLGIQPPTEVSGAAILDLVLQVLGLTEDFLWERLAVAVGPERVEQIRGALGMLGEAWSFVSDVRERGLVAVWEMVSERLSGLWDMILDTARDWLMTNLIEAAITKVLSFLDPTGIMAVINSAIAFFRAVQSVIDYVTELLLLVKSYVDTLAAIARGDIEPGAVRLEQGLADAIPMAIGFLANQVGLGNVPEKVVEIIGRLRRMITEAIDWLIAQALRLGAAALRALQGGGAGEDAAPEDHGAGPPDAAAGGELPIPTERLSLTMTGEGHQVWFERVGTTVRVFMASSQAGWLVERITRALAEPSCPDEIKPDLQTARQAVQDLEADIAESVRLYRGMKRLDAPILNAEQLTLGEYLQEATRMLVRVRVYLEDIGREHGITGLTDLGHRSRYVEGDSIAPEYRGESRWRREFYGGWLGGVDEPARTRARTEGLARWQTQHPGATIPAGFDLFHCPECDGYYSPSGTVPGYETDRRRLTVDHRIPVVEHFTEDRGGRTMLQGERVDWYNDPSNLQPMCHRCNQETLRVTDWRVTRRFRGKNDADPEPDD